MDTKPFFMVLPTDKSEYFVSLRKKQSAGVDPSTPVFNFLSHGRKTGAGSIAGAWRFEPIPSWFLGLPSGAGVDIEIKAR